MSGSSDLFCHAPPPLGNQFDDDRMLRSLMRRRFGDSLAQVRPRLREMGEAGHRRTAHITWDRVVDRLTESIR